MYSKSWTVYANVDRIQRTRDEHGVWNAVQTNPNNLLVELFAMWGFANVHASDLRTEILKKYKDGELKGKKKTNNSADDRTFFNVFVYAFNLILQLRNSDTKTAQDFIASPVEPFFATADAPRPNSCGIHLANGDSLGAYNIARKGIMTIDRIKQNPEKPDLYISKEQMERD